MLLLTAAVSWFSFTGPPKRWRRPATWIAFAQIAVPLALGLTLAGEPSFACEGGWRAPRWHLLVSTALVALPVAIGVVVAWFARGQRTPAILLAAVAILRGAGILWGFVLIGT